MLTRVVRRSGGFTLIELLVVMTILGISLGLVSLKALPSEQQALVQETRRLALLLQLARDEAIVRNHPIAFEADTDGYRFMVRSEQRQWQPITDSDQLRQRRFEHAPLTLVLEPQSSAPASRLRLVFGREPVDKPFALTLAGSAGVSRILADGLGHFKVE